MYLVKFIVLIGILAGIVVSAGCSTVKPSLMPLDSMQDPLEGAWISRELGYTTFYRFWVNGTFEAWSHSGDIHPRYSSQYKGTWKNREGPTYITEGQHIGYGEVTALAIWRDLELVYNPAGDTFSITVYPGQVFSRLLHDPDTQAGTNRSIPSE
jgi:hypothetical protein